MYFFCKIVNLLRILVSSNGNRNSFFKQYNWLNNKTITLCFSHRFILLVCIRFRVAGLEMNEIVSCGPVNDFVRFHRCVWQYL